MRMILALMAGMALAAALPEAAAANGTRPFRGGGQSFMFAPSPSHLLFHGFAGQNWFIPHRFAQPQFLVNPGPVPRSMEPSCRRFRPAAA